MDTKKHHVMFVYINKEGLLTSVRTKISHQSSGKDVSDNLLAQMAKQVRLSTKEFLDLVDCPLSRDAYDQIVAKKE